MFKLVSLTSNKNSFHSIYFKDGLNVVVGEQTIKTNDGTTNGVGKSLIIKIIDYCLGSDKVSAFIDNLSGWEFCLEIEVDSIRHSIKRSIDDYKMVVFDGQPINVKNLKDRLHNDLNITQDFSFRQILPRFLRRNKESYVSYLNSIQKEKEVDTFLVLCYLLGLEYSLCIKKKQLRQDCTNANSFYKTAFKNSTYEKIMGLNTKDIDLDISELDSSIEKAEEELKKCKYAENYSDIQSQCNELSLKLSELSNKKFYFENRISVIEDALNNKITITIQSVKELYESVGALWNNDSTKSIEAVTAFHETLIKKRNSELNKNYNFCKEQLSIVYKEIKDTNLQYNTLMEFIRTHVAIDKYANQLRHIDFLKNKKNELIKIANARKKTTNKIEEYKKELASENLKAQKYLDDNEDLFQRLNKMFVKLAKQIYPKKKSGLFIRSNTGENLNRFEIDARITSDASDGISEMIIFCFDLVLLSQRVTNFGFIYHDSLLFPNVDSRQREMLFKIIDSEFKSFQYIININSDQYANFSPKIKQVVESNVIMRLSDKDDASKLLGVEIDFGKKDL